jgi:hypothetical protein
MAPKLILTNSGKKLILSPEPDGPPTPPSLQLTPQAEVPFDESDYTALNTDTHSPIIFRNLT